MIDPFEELIDHLGTSLNVPLHVDQHRACMLRVYDSFNIQLQLDASQEMVLAVSFIATLPPGRFRTNVLTEALKANHLPDPRAGVLSYLEIKNALTLHQYHLLSKLTPPLFASHVAAFINYGKLWHDAIKQGLSSP